MKKQFSFALILLCISLFVRLCGLSSPDSVVFDEVHWGKFINAYTSTGANLFDVHPPHGKLLVVALLKLTNYDGLQNFERIGTPLTHLSGTIIRLIPALCGALIPLFLFLILLNADVSLEVAWLFSLCSALDNALVLQSRVMGLYPMLLLALVSSYYFAERVLSRQGLAKVFFIALCGIACGFAAGFQFTGITALAIVFFILIRKEVKAFVAIGCIAVVVYLIGWKIHFLLLPNPGFGDAFYRNTGGFFIDLIELHKRMYTASATLTTAHPDASAPWSWPFMTKPIFYWAQPGRSLYFLGNPIVWWGVSFLFVCNLAQRIHSREIFKKDPSRMPLAAFFISYIPLLLMKRVLFLYHYLTPLTYAVLFVGLTEKMKTKVFYFAVFLVVLGFLYISPVTYGWAMPEWYWQSLPWKLVH